MSVSEKAPHLIQYQGSKRKLAPAIIESMPQHVDRLIEPFCGVCAVSIAAAINGKASSYWLNDINRPLVLIMQEAVDNPDNLSAEYEVIWQSQFEGNGDHIAHFFHERELFNQGKEYQTPARLLYLLARCVKGAVRYGLNGQMNQSADKRRHGTKPATIRKNALLISSLLKGKCSFTALDYKEVLSQCGSDDFIYMDPPYQGTSFTRDSRYYQGVNRNELLACLSRLNRSRVPWLLSYDGKTGTKTYGEDIPPEVGIKKLLYSGKSSQASLLGRSEDTYEALYSSPNLIGDTNVCRQNKQRTVSERVS